MKTITEDIYLQLIERILIPIVQGQENLLTVYG
jgi:hypothetical protein